MQPINKINGTAAAMALTLAASTAGAHAADPSTSRLNDTILYDLINSGSEDARGTTQFTAGGGFRSRLVQNVDVGVSCEAGVVDPVGIFKGRITADVIWRF